MLKVVLDGTCDTLNFYKYPVDMPLAGEYGIPVIRAIRIKHPEKYQLVAFDECHLIPQGQRKRYIVHFYIYMTTNLNECGASSRRIQNF